MKYLYSILLISALCIAGCESSRTALRKGHYDLAVSKAVKKLGKNPADQKQLSVLGEAFKKVQQSDLDRIIFLKKEGSPDSWDDIFNIYSKIKGRQQLVKTLPEQLISSLGLQLINCDEELIQAKQKAAEYFYAHALALLEKPGRNSARQAYSDLERVKSYYNNFRETDALMAKALEQGTSNVLFRMKNQSHVILPAGFEEELTKISLYELNQKWTKYYTAEQKNMAYDYIILVNMKVIDVSPESIKETHYTESKEIQDGWNYVLDARGNVKKDSLGNDIKTPKMKRISCEVVETFKKKVARISGSVDYINNSTGQLMKSEPVISDTFFENVSDIAIGDMNVLKPETKAKIKPPMPFPGDGELLMQSAGNLKKMVKDIIWNNRQLLN